MLIGRKEEVSRLNSAYESDESEFVAVYGRRRIGKTYLVRETFKSFTFTYTGILNLSAKEQLKEFHKSMLLQGGAEAPVPESWFDAFHQLEDLIVKSKDRRKVIFIDELPWMDSHRSKFVSAFEHFWNGWASARKDILLIVCGSASSWIIDKIFKNRGGLHNRVTCKIHLKPFSLAECEEYMASRAMNLTRNELLEGYMVMGGIPFYWSKLSRGKSIAQNVNDLFLSPYGEFRYEFNELYNSLFNRPEKYIKVIEALSTKKKGLTREEIVKTARLENNGNLTQIIENLIECGFIRKYCHTSKTIRDAIYQLVDCYTLFYYQFVKGAHGVDEEYWTKLQATPKYHIWCGLAFERVCLLHTRQIKAALGISGIMANIHTWHVKQTDDHPGVQIDLLIDRADNVVSIIEMKYAMGGYTLTAQEADKINTRARVFAMYMPKKKGVQQVLITSNGLVGGRQHLTFHKELTSDCLFSV